jgi:ABC-type molybdenum transport system ATPase subunit/photorepair protein PhrA
MKFSSACLLLGIMAAKAFVPMKAGNRFASLLKMSEDRGSITRGDTRGAALLVEDVSVSRGDTQILTKVQWRVEPTAKWALVGANGAG